MTLAARLSFTTTLLLLAACSGGGGGGGGDPPVQPNAAPILTVPATVAGTLPVLRHSLPIAAATTLVFTAIDPDGESLQWSLTAAPGDAAALGLAFASPSNGSSFALELAPVAATAAAIVRLLVQDPRGGTAAVDLTIARSGAPTLTAVEPAAAFLGGPQVVSLRGTGFSLAGTVTPTVTFGGLAATAVTVGGDGALSCASPIGALPAGPTVVRVATAHGNAALPAAAFTLYRLPPVFAPQDLRLDAGSGAALEFAVAGQRAHAVFLTGDVATYRGSDDGGVSWRAALPLSASEPASEPQVIADGDQVLAVWIGAGTAVRARRSTDGGLSWLPAVRLDPATVPELLSGRPRLAADGDRRFVAWREGDPLQLAGRVVAVGSADAGASFTPMATIGDGSANQDACEIACVPGGAVAVFEDDRSGPLRRGVFADRTADGGLTWGLDRRLSRADALAAGVRLAVSGSQVHAAWIRDGAVYHNGSADGGIVFQSQEELVRGSDAGAVSAIDIAAEATRVHVVYVAGGSNVWLARSTDGVTFPQQVAIELGAQAAAQPVVRSLGNYAVAAWRRGEVAAGLARVVHATSTDRGATFTVPTGLGDGDATQTEPRLALRGAALLLGWRDLRAAASGVFTNASVP